MRLIIAGCRDFDDYGVMLVAMIKYLETNPRPDEIVSGAALGVDRMGERWAEENKIPVRLFPADWKKYGYSAGPRRNAEMALHADRLLVLWDGQSRGTGNMVAQMKAVKKPVYIYPIGKPDLEGVRSIDR